MGTLFLFYGCGAGDMCMSSEAHKKWKSSGKWNDWQVAVISLVLGVELGSCAKVAYRFLTVNSSVQPQDIKFLERFPV